MTKIYLGDTSSLHTFTEQKSVISVELMEGTVNDTISNYDFTY